MALASFEHHFRSGTTIEIEQVLVGRVTSSLELPSELNRPCKAVAWVFGQEGIQHILEQPMVAALEGLGFDGGFVYNRLKAGEDFYLIVCEQAALGNVQPVTWDGVFSMLAELHGDEIAKKVQQHQHAIETTSFKQFEQSTAANWRDIRWRVEDCTGEESLAETGHEWYITLEKLNTMQTADVTAAQARNFLFVHFGLNQFFAGTARTKPPPVCTSNLAHDFPGVPEFLCPNVNLEFVRTRGACLILKFDRDADKAYLEWLSKLQSPEEANVTQYSSEA